MKKLYDGNFRMKQLTNQQVENIIEMIGCNKEEFYNIVKDADNRFFMTATDEWFSKYTIIGEKGTLAEYNHRGELQ